MGALFAACSFQTSRPAAAPEPNVQPPAAAPASVNAGGPSVAAPPAVAPLVATPVAPTATASMTNAVNPAQASQSTAPATATAAASPTQAPTAVPTATAVPSPTPLVYSADRLTDRMGSAQTSYAGSIPERAWNVELAAKRLDGTVVPPGGVFSFNQAVGPTTIKAGFKVGYGITFKDNQPETIPSVAGGICQVATTVFQAAFWAGFPIVERHYHLYWIPRYGQPPSGRVGFDATVDDPGVDFKFKNTTDDFIRLNAWFDGANVGFVIRGVEPGWEVDATKPKVFDPVKTNPAVVKQQDWTMPYGRQLDVEHAEDGFKVTVTRLVKLKGKVVDEYTFTNKYLPARNVTLVGMKGAPATPTPAASGTPDPDGTPPPNGTPGAEGTPAPQATRSAQPTATPVPPAAPTKLPNGQIKVPSLVGLSEAQARKAVEQAGLNNTYSNYQGPGQVPKESLESVAVGSVLSQSPAPGTAVGPGSTVHLAVRKG